MMEPSPTSMNELDYFLDHPKTSHIVPNDFDHSNQLIPSFRCWSRESWNRREWSVWLVWIIGNDVWSLGMVQEMIELNHIGRTRFHHGVFQALNQAISAFSSGKSHMDFLRRFKIDSRGEIAYRSWYLRETSDHEGQLTYHGCCRPATHDGDICIAIFITKICKIYSSTSWRSET